MVSVWSKVQTCIWPSWCHYHSLSLAPVKSRLVLPFWCRLTRVVPKKGPLNECVCVCVCVCVIQIFPLICVITCILICLSCMYFFWYYYCILCIRHASYGLPGAFICPSAHAYMCACVCVCLLLECWLANAIFCSPLYLWNCVCFTTLCINILDLKCRGHMHFSVKFISHVNPPVYTRMTLE